MSDEKIQLPDFLIAELYKGSLVDLDTFKSKAASPEAKEPHVISEEAIPTLGKVKFLGDNKQKVVIIVNQPKAVFLMEDELVFLTSILKACQLNLADIAIVNLSTQSVSYEAIKEQLHPRNLLLFDVEPSAVKLPFLIPSFQIQKFDNCTIMVAPPLSLLNKPDHEGKLLKTKLWLSLKQVFNIA